MLLLFISSSRRFIRVPQTDKTSEILYIAFQSHNKFLRFRLARLIIFSITASLNAAVLFLKVLRSFQGIFRLKQELYNTLIKTIETFNVKSRRLKFAHLSIYYIGPAVWNNYKLFDILKSKTTNHFHLDTDHRRRKRGGGGGGVDFHPLWKLLGHCPPQFLPS